MPQLQGLRNLSSTSQKSLSQHLSVTSQLNDSELVKQVNELKQQVIMLTLENEIFEKSIMRVEPALMNGVQQALEYAVKLHKRNQSNSSSTVGSFHKSELTSSPSRRISSFTSPSRVSAKRSSKSSVNRGGIILYGTVSRINVLERSELVFQEMELVTLNHEKIKKKAASEHAILQAKLEEIGVRVADIDKAVAKFQQQVIVEGRDKIAQRIPAEVWIRFMTEWVKTIDRQIDKLHLRTTTLNTEYIKLRVQTREKTELRERLQPVDIDLLKIKNIENEELIEQKTQHNKQLKQMAGNANLSVNIHKKTLIAQKKHLIKINETIRNRKEETVRMDKKIEGVKVEADTLAQKLHKIQKVRQVNEMPDIMDYVEMKSELTDLKQNVKLLERRLQIAQGAVSSITKKLNYLQRTKEVKILDV